VVLFSVVETSLVYWILHGVWSCLQHLHVLVPSSRSLKIASVLDHPVLRSCIALFFGWMGPLLELLLDSRHGRVDLAVGCLRAYHCHIRAVLQIGTNVRKVTLLSIVVALPISQSSCHILVPLGWGR
jgi:formate hydrogenlyase subunit 4